MGRHLDVRVVTLYSVLLCCVGEWMPATVLVDEDGLANL